MARAWVAAVALGALVGACHGESAGQPPPPPKIPSSQFAVEQGTVRQVEFVQQTPVDAPLEPVPPNGYEMAPLPPQPPVPMPPAPKVIEEKTAEFKFPSDGPFDDVSRYRYIPGMDGGFGIQTLEWGHGWGRLWHPDYCTSNWTQFGADLGYAIHWWEGPKPRAELGERAPDLPPRVYDLYFDFTWQQRVAEWLAFDFLVSPGLYGDFDTTPPQAFRMKGHAMGVLSLDYCFHLVGGFEYINRETVEALPIVGIVWRPTIGVSYELVLPRPRVSFRLGANGPLEWWGYVGGEYGGGAWAYKTSTGSHTHVEYNDLRIVAGLELRSCEMKEVRSHLEIGYVFDRELNSEDGFPDFTPKDTFVVGLSFTY